MVIFLTFVLLQKSKKLLSFTSFKAQSLAFRTDLSALVDLKP